MNCNNLECRNNIIKSFNCLKCDLRFCSNNCMLQHVSESHQIKNANSYITQNTTLNVKSPFIKQGEFINEIKNDSIYNYENFEYVKKANKKHILGTGAFGEVYLAKNKIDGNLYAIKHMEKSKIIEHGAKLDIISREINIHRRLIHDNIIKMYSYFEDQKSYYIVIID